MLQLYIIPGGNILIKGLILVWFVIRPFVSYQPAVCSFYGGERFNGNLTASGTVFNDTLMIVAHRTLPLGTILEIRNIKGDIYKARVEDRGPFVLGRVFDLSAKLFSLLGNPTHGVVEFEYRIVGYNTEGLRWNF